MSAIDKFGMILRELRKQRGLTQDELAHKTKRSVDAVSQWERGVAWPSFETLILLCQALDVPVKTFLENGEHGRSEKRDKLEATAQILLNDLPDDDLEVAVEQLRALANRKSR